MTAPDHPVPRATYRLQLNKSFTFQHALGIVPYLGRLGISHVYLSPILKAQPGSTHGYDTVDHSQINPEIGTEAEFRELAAALKAQNIGIVLDFVPNHMGVGGADNPQWLDVLENGPNSPYADWFDIDWNPAEPTLKNKLLVPFMGVAYGEALTSGVLKLKYDPESRKFAVWAHDAHKLPLSPESAVELTAGRVAEGDIQALVGEINSDPAKLDRLIGAQHWRIAYAQVASDDINYRRFFTISELGGIRIEREVVFDHAHHVVFGLIADGLIDGLRIDHVDGLADPKGYLLALRKKAPRPIYLVVEKILGPDEPLRLDWEVDGTTGYEFASLVTPLLTEPSAEQTLTEFYSTFANFHETPEDIEYDMKLRVMDAELQAELDGLSYRLRRIAVATSATQDLTRTLLKKALREVVAVLSVYRTYVDADGIVESDRQVLAQAFALARKNQSRLPPATFDFLEKLMTGELTTGETGTDTEAVQDAIRRIQQYSGPVMAKGLEDTALYRYNRLLALNEVGERPQIYAHGFDVFHASNQARLEQVPNCMLTSSSHDTKRGEDTRARIIALTGDVAGWQNFVVEATSKLQMAGAPEIDPNDLYVFLQLLLGAWPAEFSGDAAPSPKALETLAERLTSAMMKSLREARLRSDWVFPDSDYEKRITDLIKVALSPLLDNPVLQVFRTFEAKISRWGADLGLVQALWKLTVPGMPDIYQGAELWEQSLVDPDNRRPVDFSARAKLLDEIEAHDDLLAFAEDWRSGAIKLGLHTRLLEHRTENPELYRAGSYTPLEVSGSDSSRICAFLRQDDASALVVVAALQPWKSSVGDARVSLPAGNWSNLLRKSPVSGTEALDLTPLLDTLPVAVLARG